MTLPKIAWLTLCLLLPMASALHAQQAGSPIDAAPTFQPATAAEARAAAIAGGDYLVHVTRPNGKFIYLYLPQEDEVPEEYNWLRHAGTIAALCQLYSVSEDPEHLRAARLAAAAMVTQIKEVSVEGTPHWALVSDYASTGHYKRSGPVVKAGGAALAIFALDWLDRVSDGQTNHLYHMQVLGQYLLAARDAESGVPRSKLLLKSGQFDDWQSGYYPGQCLLAFAILQRRDGSGIWSEPLHRLMAYQTDRILYRLKGMERSGFDHWTMIGMREAYPHIDFSRLKLEALDSITGMELQQVAAGYCSQEIAKQLTQDPRSPGYGTWGTHAGITTPTAIRLEGFHAVRLMVDEATVPASLAAEQQRLKDHIAGWDKMFGIAYAALIRGQYQEPIEGARYNVTGGVRNSIVIDDAKAGQVQIDYVQHAISGWLGI